MRTLVREVKRLFRLTCLSSNTSLCCCSTCFLLVVALLLVCFSCSFDLVLCAMDSGKLSFKRDLSLVLTHDITKSPGDNNKYVMALKKNRVPFANIETNLPYALNLVKFSYQIVSTKISASLCFLWPRENILCFLQLSHTSFLLVGNSFDMKLYFHRRVQSEYFLWVLWNMSNSK